MHIVDRRLNPGSKSLENRQRFLRRAKRRLAEAEHEGLRRAGYAVSGSPANIAVGRTMRVAMARRVALRRPRPETIEQLEAEIADCEGEDRAALRAELEALKAKMRR